MAQKYVLLSFTMILVPMGLFIYRLLHFNYLLRICLLSVSTQKLSPSLSTITFLFLFLLAPFHHWTNQIRKRATTLVYFFINIHTYSLGQVDLEALYYTQFESWSFT